MNAHYPARYRDANGGEAATIQNDGTTLRMRLRGVAFSANGFDGFEPDEDTDPAALISFRLHRNELCACTIECAVPLPVIANGNATEAVLHVSVVLGEPTERVGLDKMNLYLRLDYAGNEYPGVGRDTDFEGELVRIQQALPKGVFLKACINCAFSDYSPSGQQLFGSMACFRDNKEAYLQVRDKMGIFRIWDTHTEYVQETYLCPEFLRRMPGTGYRG